MVPRLGSIASVTLAWTSKSFAWKLTTENPVATVKKKAVKQIITAFRIPLDVTIIFNLAPRCDYVQKRKIFLRFRISYQEWKKGGSLTCPDFFSWCSISLSSHSTCLRMLCSEQPLKYIKAFLASSNRPLDTSHLGLGSEAAKTMNWATGTTHADSANQFQSSTDPNE